MKTYSLNQDFFNSFSEACETLDYLDEAFPDLLSNDALKNYSNQSRIPNTPNRLAVIIAFREILDSNANRFGEIMNTRDNSLRQAIIDSVFFMQENDDRLFGISIYSALEDNLLIETDVFRFTPEEVSFIRANLAHSGNLYSNIIDKLNGKQ